MSPIALNISDNKIFNFFAFVNLYCNLVILTLRHRKSSVDTQVVADINGFWFKVSIAPWSEPEVSQALTNVHY